MAFSGWLYSGNEMDNLREEIENLNYRAMVFT